MKKPLIIGNWKANPKGEKEAKNLIKNIEKKLGRLRANFAIAPPDVFLKSVKDTARKAMVGGQNLGSPTLGSHTGDSAPLMYKSLKSDFVILGHSEVREKGEENQTINKKILAAIGAKLPIVLCIGERERDANGKYLKGIEDQIKECLRSVNKEDASLITLAYEPVWAVGADFSATSEECFEAIIAIRRCLANIFTIDYAKKISVLYGGTVTKDNAKDFLDEGGADGLLIGRASLDADHFTQILKLCYEARA